MKRLYLLILLLLSMVTNLAAQVNDYKPFVEEGKHWVCSSLYIINIYDRTYSLKTYHYLLDGDTLINNIQYIRCLQYDEGQDISQASVFGCVREEGHKVFIIPMRYNYESHNYPETNSEVLLYDFDNPNNVFAVDFINFSTTDSIQGRKAFSWNRYNSLNSNNIVEGIGYDSDLNCDSGDPFRFVIWEMLADWNYYAGLQYVEDVQGNIIYQGKAFYPRLVREGVQWHYCVYQQELDNETNEYPYSSYRIEFRGDTLINGDMCKKCYRYTESYLDTSKHYPVAYCFEDQFKQVFLYPNHNNPDSLMSRWYNSSITIGDSEPYLLYSFGNIAYDFSDVYGFLKSKSCTVTDIQQIQIDNYFANSFSLDSEIFSDDAHLVESVGIDGSLTGDLISPFITHSTPRISGISGLQKVTDLKGKVIYKGALYRDPFGDLSGDGLVDVSDINAAIDVVVGKAENGKADVNCDGRVDIADINSIVNVILNSRK